MFIFIFFIVIILILSGTGTLGIFLSRKSVNIKKITSKSSTIIFLILLSILAFFGELSLGRTVAWSFGHTLGYVWMFTFPTAALGVLFINRFKFKEKEIWPSWFFTLLWIIPLFIKDYIFKIN